MTDDKIPVLSLNKVCDFKGIDPRSLQAIGVSLEDYNDVETVSRDVFIERATAIKDKANRANHIPNISPAPITNIGLLAELSSEFDDIGATTQEHDHYQNNTTTTTMSDPFSDTFPNKRHQSYKTDNDTSEFDAISSEMQVLGSDM